MKIKLYRTIRGERRLVDYGVVSKCEYYKAQGYEVEGTRPEDNQALYHVVKAEFDKLWYQLPAEEKRRLADIPMDWEMTIEQKLGILKSEIATRKKRSITVVHVPAPKKVSVFSTLFNVAKEFVNSLIPEMEVCYA
jgi:hypothetical protein